MSKKQSRWTTRALCEFGFSREEARDIVRAEDPERRFAELDPARRARLAAEAEPAWLNPDWQPNSDEDANVRLRRMVMGDPSERAATRLEMLRTVLSGRDALGRKIY